jgi:hypothetical protein
LPELGTTDALRIFTHARARGQRLMNAWFQLQAYLAREALCWRPRTRMRSGRPRRPRASRSR